MRFPLKSAVLLCGLLACAAARAEPSTCQRFKQQYAEQYAQIDCVDKDTAVVRNRQNEYAVADSQNRLSVPFGTYAAIVTFIVNMIYFSYKAASRRQHRWYGKASQRRMRNKAY